MLNSLRVALTAGAVALAFLVSPNVKADQVYNCQFIDMVTLNDDGKLGRYPRHNEVLRQNNPLIIDTASGIIRIGTPATIWRWSIIQQGNNSMDWIIAPDPTLGVRNSITNFIRLRTWNENRLVTVIYFGLTSLHSGTCSRIGS